MTRSLKFSLLLILALGLFLRLYGLNWDQGGKFHPDERAIIMNVTNSDFHFPHTPTEWANLLTPQGVLNPHWFPYGSLPLYLLKFLGWLGSFVKPEFGTYDKINLVGRAASAFFDIGTIYLVYLLAKSLKLSTNSQLIAAFLYATAVLPIQLSHFYAVDIPLTFFITLTLYLCLNYLKHPSILNILATGLASGLALATKTSALPIFVPITLSLLFANSKHLRRLLSHSLLGFVACGLVFAVCMPYALIDFPAFIKQVQEQQVMTRDAFTFPFTLQYVHKPLYLYELKNIFLWGLGPVLATLAFMGVIYSIFVAFKHKNAPLLILNSYLLIFFLIVGHFAIGFMRYLAPIYPLLILFATLVISQIKNKFGICVLCIVALVWPLAFVTIYAHPNTRTTASAWMNQHLPAGSRLAIEHWDDGLPVGPNAFSHQELTLYDGDNPDKWSRVTKVLASSDYIVLASNRLYVPLMKLTDCAHLPPGRCYTQTAQYYYSLFANQLGFTKIAEFSVTPQIPFTNIYIDDQSADESFTVYDHPKILIFQKQP